VPPVLVAPPQTIGTPLIYYLGTLAFLACAILVVVAFVKMRKRSGQWDE